MHFVRVATWDATGCLPAHSLRASTGRLRKGRCLEAADIAALLEYGHESVIVVRLGEADEHEKVAAARVAEALVGEAHNLRLSRASTGRVNVFAKATGLRRVCDAFATIETRDDASVDGCARSARDNGLDRLLDRVACGLPFDQPWLESLAVGGLLDEIVERPAPRILHGAGTPEPDRIAAILLAAGASRRAGATNKLLHPIDGVPMIARIAATLSRSSIDRLLVVTGHDADAVVAAIEQTLNTASPSPRSSMQFCHNEAHASGMSSSLVHGVSAANDNHAAVLICLGDMPDIDTGLIDQLLDAWRDLPASDRYRRIVIPVFSGRRGNPVVIGRVFFDLLLALEGDIGARSLIASHPGAVLEVGVDSDAILIDHDTLDELHARNAGSP